MSNVTKTELIESKIDRQAAGAVSVSNSLGGVAFQNMGEVMEFAKTMAVAGIAVPPHLRNQPGVCLAICIQAIEWRMSPYAVANKSYVVNDRISYESQLIHAVIEQRAPMIGRLKNRYIGEGGKRQCIVWANVRGEDHPLEYTSSTFESITPKNSPLWKTKPDLQLYYNASRDWARMYFPDVILGVYSEDELPSPECEPKRLGVDGLLSKLKEKQPDEPEPKPEPKLEPEPAANSVEAQPEAPPAKPKAKGKQKPLIPDEPKESTAEILARCNTEAEVDLQAKRLVQFGRDPDEVEACCIDRLQAIQMESEQP